MQPLASNQEDWSTWFGLHGGSKHDMMSLVCLSSGDLFKDSNRSYYGMVGLLLKIVVLASQAKERFVQMFTLGLNEV